MAAGLQYDAAALSAWRILTSSNRAPVARAPWRLRARRARQTFHKGVFTRRTLLMTMGAKGRRSVRIQPQRRAAPVRQSPGTRYREIRNLRTKRQQDRAHRIVLDAVG